MAFTIKSVNPTGRIGADLEELRIRAGYSRSEASHATKIAESFLRALEEEDWGSIPDPVYSERILKSYVVFLGGNETYFLEKYRECLRGRHSARRPEELLPRPRQVNLSDLIVGSRLLTVAGFVAFVLLLGGYVFIQARAISTPPPLSVSSPEDGLRLEQPLVHVVGKTLAETSVTVNGRQAVVQPDGVFDLSMDVPRGTTMIVISARKRHGHEAVITRRVVYDRDLPAFEVVTSTDISSTTSTTATTSAP